MMVRIAMLDDNNEEKVGHLMTPETRVAARQMRKRK